MTTHVDVAIVGGGPVGNTLALALQALSIPVALLEATPQTQSPQQSDGRAIALTYGSSQLLQQLGVWEVLLPQTTALRKVHVSKRGGFGRMVFDAKKLRVPALGYVVDMSALMSTLTAESAKAQQIECIAPANVIGVKRQAKGWELHYQHCDEVKTLTASLLIAADGANSTVRRLLDADVDIKEYGEHAMVANITLANDHHHVAYERFTAAGPVAMLPGSGKRCKAVWTLPSDKVEATLAQDRSVLLSELQTMFGYRLGRFLSMEKPMRYPLRQVMMPTQVFPGVVFVGNAAHSMHPVAAQGLNMGLQDVAILVDCLQQAQQQGQPIDDFSTLQMYAAKRQPVQKKMMRFTHSLTEIFTSTMPGMSLASNVGLLLLNVISPAKTIVARTLMGLPNKNSLCAPLKIPPSRKEPVET